MKESANEAYVETYKSDSADNEMDRLLDSNSNKSKTFFEKSSVLIANIKKEKNIDFVGKNDYLNSLYKNMPFTVYHLMMIISVFLLRTIEGTEILSMSLAENHLMKYFGIEDTVFINLAIFFGNFLGCLIAVLVNDKFSRKKIVMIGTILVMVFGFLSVFSTSLLFFTINRNLTNIGIGMTLSTSTALITESMNINYRGFVLNVILISTPFGELLISLALGSFIDLSHEDPSAWKKLFLIAFAPVVLSAVLLPFYPDSLFYYLNRRDINKVVEIADYYFYQFDTAENIKMIMDDPNISQDDPDQVEFANNSQGYITLVLAFLSGFMVVGIKYVLPKTLELMFEHHPTRMNLELQLSSVLSGLCSMSVGLFIENSLFQRLRFMKAIMIITTFLSFSAYFIPESLDLIACVVKSTVIMTDQILEIYASESLKTKERVFFLGLFNIVQGITAFISPLVNDLIMIFGFKYNYLLFGSVMIIVVILSRFLHRDKFKALIK
jgi:putative MFS transporter